MKYQWQNQKKMNKLLQAMKYKKDVLFNLTENQKLQIVCHETVLTNIFL